MAKSINNITSVWVIERHTDVVNLAPKPGITNVIELTEEEIRTYYTEYKKRKKLNLIVTKTDEKEMKAFFSELYDFVRSAEICCRIVDDCIYEVTFNYGPLHREVFEGATVNGERTLIGMIHRFTDHIITNGYQSNSRSL